MLNYIWCGIIIFSIFCSFFTGNIENMSNSILSSASDAIELIITMCGTICLWSGIMEIADKSGASSIVAKLLSPILSKLFPDIDKKGNAFRAICANVTANLLGLGNAATPLGIKAMQELEKETCSTLEKSASKSMVMFVILNTSSIQLMPTMIISILDSCGCTDPTSIIPCVWIASLCGLVVAVCSVNIFMRNNEQTLKRKG